MNSSAQFASEKATILFFAFNRPAHTRRALEALSRADGAAQSRLIIHCDGPRVDETAEMRARIAEVREIAASRPWCGDVEFRFQDSNLGLKRHLLESISAAIERSERIIVVEDDVLVSPGFLTFLNSALEIYSEDEQVMHVSAYSPLRTVPPGYAETTYFLNHSFVGWGWATWRRAWQRLSTDGASLQQRLRSQGLRRYVNLEDYFEFYWALAYLDYGLSQDWNCYWHSSIVAERGFCLHPVTSLADNIGFDGSGFHCAGGDDSMLRPVTDRLPIHRIPIAEVPVLRRLATQVPWKRRFEVRAKHQLRNLLFERLGLGSRWFDFKRRSAPRP
jgi:hypothetical protein